jgi:glutaredoxin
MALELYGTKSCPYTAELRDELEFKGSEFVEYDVEDDPAANRRRRSARRRDRAYRCWSKTAGSCRSA